MVPPIIQLDGSSLSHKFKVEVTVPLTSILFLENKRANSIECKEEFSRKSLEELNYTLPRSKSAEIAGS